MIIRLAETRDAAAVAVLINAINSLDGPGPALPMTEAVVLRDLIGAAARARLMVAEAAGRVIAFASAAPVYDAERQADALMLLDLYTDPAHRRRGAARGLMAGMAAHARSIGAGCLWWGVDEGDDEAMLFYRAIGAVSEGRFSGEILQGHALERLAAGA